MLIPLRPRKKPHHFIISPKNRQTSHLKRQSLEELLLKCHCITVRTMSSRFDTTIAKFFADSALTKEATRIVYKTVYPAIEPPIHLQCWDT